MYLSAALRPPLIFSYWFPWNYFERSGDEIGFRRVLLMVARHALAMNAERRAADADLYFYKFAILNGIPNIRLDFLSIYDSACPCFYIVRIVFFYCTYK